MNRTILVSILALVACNLDSRLESSSSDAPIDTPLDDMSEPACNPDAPFGQLLQVAAVNASGVDCDGWLSSDGLTMFFRTDRAGGPGFDDLWSATRSTLAADFGAAAPIPNVNTAEFENKIAVTSDELTMFVGSTRTGPGHDIYTVSRSEKSEPFGTPGVVLNVNAANKNDVPGSINALGTVLYMSSDRSGDEDLYTATRTNPATAFGAPVKIAELSQVGVDNSAPVISSDELTIFYGSKRAGGSGLIDVWTAKRSSPTGTFGNPVNVIELNSGANDQPTWISPDGCQILVMSDRVAGLQDIYVATRSK